MNIFELEDEVNAFPPKDVREAEIESYKINPTSDYKTHLETILKILKEGKK